MIASEPGGWNAAAGMTAALLVGSRGLHKAMNCYRGLTHELFHDGCKEWRTGSRREGSPAGMIVV